MLMTILVSLGIAIGLSWLNLVGHRLGDVLLVLVQQASHCRHPSDPQQCRSGLHRMPSSWDSRSTLDQGGSGLAAWAGLRGPTLPRLAAARLAVPLLLAVVGEPVADADAAVALGAKQQHVGDVDRHLLGEPSPLGVLLARPQVLVDAVDPLDDDLVPRRE